MLDTGTGANMARDRIPVWTWRDAINKAPVEPLTKLVCHVIACYLSDAGKSWRIPVKTIIADTGLSNWAVAKHLRLAREAGLLAVKREIGKHGQRGITSYAPRFPEYMDLAHEPAEFMQSEPSEPLSSGEPHERRSSGHVSDPHLGHVSDAHDKYLSTNKNRSSSFQEEAAQARPAAEVAADKASQPKSRKPKAGKVDLLGEEVPKRTRTTKTHFPENPDPDTVAEWLEFGQSIGLTEEETQAGLINCRLHHMSEGSRKADWTPTVQKWLLGDRDRKRKRANGTSRTHTPSWADCWAQAEAGRA